MAEAPGFMHTLVGRFDDSVFDPGRRSRCRIRLEVDGQGAWDAVTSGGRVSIQAAENHPDAVLSADGETWQRLAVDLGQESFVTSLQGKTLGSVILLACDDRILLRADPGALAPLLPHLQKYGLFDDIPEDLRVGKRLAVRIAREIAEGI